MVAVYMPHKDYTYTSKSGRSQVNSVKFSRNPEDAELTSRKHGGRVAIRHPTYVDS